MEINNLPVELTVVWNGHFNIDNPAQNKGVKRAGREGRKGLEWGKGGKERAEQPCTLEKSSLPSHPSLPATVNLP